MVFFVREHPTRESPVEVKCFINAGIKNLWSKSIGIKDCKISSEWTEHRISLNIFRLRPSSWLLWRSPALPHNAQRFHFYLPLRPSDLFLSHFKFWTQTTSQLLVAQFKQKKNKSTKKGKQKIHFPYYKVLEHKWNLGLEVIQKEKLF